MIELGQPNLELPIQDPPQNVPIHSWSFNLNVNVVDFLSGYRVAGVLEAFTPGEVVVTFGEPLSEQRAVSVHISSFVFEGQILYCQLRGDRYEAHITIDDAGETGLRKAPRFPVKLPARLFPPHLSPVDITIVDLSSDGLGFESPLSLETGQSIAVASDSVFVFAIVRHCRPLSDGLFRAGVQIQHLFEKAVDVPVTLTGSRFLGTVWGNAFPK